MEKVVKIALNTSEETELYNIHKTVLKMFNRDGLFRANPTNDSYYLGDVRFSIFFFTKLPNQVEASDISDKFFFSTSGSKIWNYVANQSFFSVNFSETKNDYFDEWAGQSSEYWDKVLSYLVYVLGSAVRKYGDTDIQVFKDAVKVVNEVISHNRNEIHYACPMIPEGRSAYSVFIEWALNATLG